MSTATVHSGTLGSVLRVIQKRLPIVIGGLLVSGVLLAAATAPYVAPHDPTLQHRDGVSDAGIPLAPGESGRFVLGTDSLGRDVLSRLLYGARTSMVVGILANGLAIVIGLAIGLGAGHSDGVLQNLLMRAVDILMSIPLILLAIALSAILRPSLTIVILVVGAVYWTGMARVIYGEVLTLRELDFVLAARALGASGWRVMATHLMPSLMPIVIVVATLGIGTTIRVEATLSYLGVGVPPPAPTWGNMILEGQGYYRLAPWLVLIPGAVVMVAVLGFNVLGEGLRDALDPLRRSQDQPGG